jgi:hypothetical protein
MLSQIQSFHVLTGLLCLLCPCEFYDANRLAILQSSIHMTWPYDHNCLSSLSCYVCHHSHFGSDCFISDSVHLCYPCQMV